MFKSMWFALGLVVALWQAPAQAVEVGDSVLAYWEPGKAYFIGTVVENRGDSYQVVFEDGDTAIVSAKKIRPHDLKVGRSVIARWEDGESYRGKIAQVVGRAYYIHYSDGDKGWAPWSWIAVE